MEWLTGLALLPALLCGVMMGGMALAAALGLRRNQGTSAGDEVQVPQGPQIPQGVPADHEAAST